MAPKTPIDPEVLAVARAKASASDLVLSPSLAVPVSTDAPLVSSTRARGRPRKALGGNLPPTPGDATQPALASASAPVGTSSVAEPVASEVSSPRGGRLAPAEPAPKPAAKLPEPVAAPALELNDAVKYFIKHQVSKQIQSVAPKAPKEPKPKESSPASQALANRVLQVVGGAPSAASADYWAFSGY